MSGAAQAFILLVLFGAAAYLILGTGAGRRIKENLDLSFAKSCVMKAQRATPLPTLAAAEKTPEATAVPTAAPTGETARVKLRGIDIYMLQLGVFDDRANCERAAEAVKALGAAGYVYEDNGSFRLIAAAYSDEASAGSVKERLVSEGRECSVIKLSSTEVELVVTSSVERLLPIRTAFALAPETVDQLDELALDFDASNRSEEYALGVLSEMERNSMTASEGIGEAATRNAMLEKVNAFYTDIAEKLRAASTGFGSRAELSSRLKYLRVYAALRYAELLKDIGE